jgi:signal transduction histidine kinase
VAIVDIIVILWLASQTTRPVERLARAVRDDRLDQLKPGGPREIIELGESFSQLRQHLRALLDERTRMLAAIAHDYRTYLTRMDLRSEFIEDEDQRLLAQAGYRGNACPAERHPDLRARVRRDRSGHGGL